ncbi:regulator of Sig8 [Mycobacterium intermedium]|uniref:Regulator of Sig8 n=1 Tax=Mycobacterium intermedium TaxID=28445 RepID=A0A1E3S9J3_MYCIE|nr:sensor histidine kinase [Mycobacterium intermedium]MCV6966610.1 sensor histidine kinase [Mycobacterium intermedium]ODQ98799.1 regulator of Sig8 [Mycobacterium intermedium]OPE44995.1 regulator of Sig8 [Mycobacterium intermedium]ORB04666.1 regulator of Sig8 [Mycobacterium intermedium]
MTASMETEQRSFVHSALFYHSQREYLDFVVRFVAEGMAADEPVLVAIPGEKLPPLRAELAAARAGSTAELRLVDITDVCNPSRFLAMETAFAERHSDQQVRIVSQLVWPGRSDEECLACVQHEALVNGALTNHNVLGLCLYDAERLEDDVLAGARTTHPLVWKCGSAYRSTEYAPEVALAWCNQPLPTNPSAVTYTVRKSTDLRPARSFATDYAGWVGLSQDGIEDLQMIATELATNSLQYTGGACQLAFWRQNDHLVCEARDGGQFNNLLVGVQPPGPNAKASRGLFLVNAIADLVRTHTTANGTTIQAYLRLNPARGQAS